MSSSKEESLEKNHMEEILIRKANLNDLETLLRFEQELIHAERPFDPTLRKGHFHYYDIKEMIAAQHIRLIVAESGREVIGSGYARIESAKPYLQHTQYAYLGFMYTDPEHRGKGVNKKIIDALKEWALSQHIYEMRLEVYADNKSALHAYEKAGFANHMMEMRMDLKGI
jgi:GNAT superfamily N-acetyltransferase